MSSGQSPVLVRVADWKSAGQLLRELRERNGRSHAEAAERANVTEVLVVANEHARVPSPELEARWRLTAALGVILPAFLAAAERRSGVSLLAGVRPLAAFTLDAGRDRG